eukprot:5851164-Karenia_brevis.AAC.1
MVAHVDGVISVWVPVYVTCKDSTDNILPINCKRAGRSSDLRATEVEIAQVRSVNGSLSWIAGQSRPRICSECSRLQSAVNMAQVK